MTRRRSTRTSNAAQAAAKGRKSATSSKKRPATRKKAASKTSSPPKLPELQTGERHFILDIPFEMRGIAQAYKAKYIKEIGNVYTGTSLPPGLEPFASKDFSYERWLEDDLNKKVKPTAVSPNPMKPRPHQIDAIKRIIGSAKAGYRGFVEADDVGLGKTLACAYGAYGALQARGGTNVLIMCPKGVMEHWRNTLRSLPQNPRVRYCIINYDRAKKLLTVPESAKTAKRTRTKNSRIVNQGTPTVRWDVIIADESHKLKNINTSQRAKAFSTIARYEQDDKKAPFIIWASATIGQNPTELGYLSPLLAQMTKSSKTSLKQWGQWLEDNNYHGEYNERFSKWEWTENPKEQESDLKRINALLFSPQSPSIRRLPTDVAGWPEMNRILTLVDLDNEQMSLYESLWTDFRQSMSLLPKGNDPKGLAVQLRFRQKTSLLKIDSTLEHTLDLLENGKKVIISLEFIESLNILRDELTKKGYKVEEFSGQNVDEREAARLRFQKGKADVMLFTVREGISLHAGEHLADGTRADMTPRETIIHDIPYSAFDVAQISGRGHRDGQFSNIFLITAKDTIEEKITRVVIERLYSMKRITGDDVSFISKLQNILIGN